MNTKQKITDMRLLDKYDLYKTVEGIVAGIGEERNKQIIHRYKTVCSMTNKSSYSLAYKQKSCNM